MTEKITWLHLSDLHARKQDEWDVEQVITKLIADLKALQKEKGLVPDLVFFTGDLAYGNVPGDTMSGQCQAASRFIEAVATAYEPPIPRERIYVVPGNHDVDRKEVTPGENNWLRDRSRQKSEINAVLRDGNKQWRLWCDRLNSYRNFLVTHGFRHLNPDDPHLIWTNVVDFKGIKIGIAGLNTAWSCFDEDDNGRLWMGGDWQISEVRKRLGSVDFTIALTHHPSNWLNPEESSHIGRKLRKEFDVVVHGHEHVPFVDVNQNNKIMISAGACYQCSWMSNSAKKLPVPLQRKLAPIP